MEKEHEIWYRECIKPVEMRVTFDSTQGISLVQIKFVVLQEVRLDKLAL
jgi:hypothetical protein